jgi:cytoskeletal protein CcmA (bactofilin family)
MNDKTSGAISKQEPVMFGKRNNEGGGNEGTKSLNVLNKGTYLKGIVKVDGSIHVNGDIDGELTVSDTLIVGKPGNIKASVTTKSAIISGRVIGAIRSERRLEMRAGSHIEGDVFTKCLVVDEGVFYQGKCFMKDFGSTEGKGLDDIEIVDQGKDQKKIETDSRVGISG